MKYYLVMMASGLLFCSGCDHVNTVTVFGDESHFPLAAGNEWVYNDTWSGDGQLTIATVKLDSAFTSDGIKWYGVNNYCKGIVVNSPLPIACAAWAKNKNRLLSHGYGPGPVQLEYETVLDFPLYVGKEWILTATDTTYIANGYTVKFSKFKKRKVRSFSSVTVPAGNFEGCFEVVDTSVASHEFHFPDGEILRDSTIANTNEWYQRNVGMVKQTIETIYVGYDVPNSFLKRELRRYNVNLNE